MDERIEITTVEGNLISVRFSNITLVTRQDGKIFLWVCGTAMGEISEKIYARLARLLKREEDDNG